ncbi:GTP-binding protein 1 [Toxorhynchites rutilus septentrionalis]|uniref:GTP-binding protein 1 n=1 Tax=Toxorhynchites rutilus septentrionalis TaxID=329112 RepID=UPI0024785C97|nr:GTP-binding protein 1 [Toxorhynchites rutilus septentrionalis]XP_055630759.1 GTP-binding protein 1 [Toxorhynchites rutilus septentrionalis]XP_055630760.1 GTP-binding protein 1 [Toxorhynchites rutilus septentrionalis]XP_055630761.1 GTP-binding protein 1 [Toxorhynchites rutilus septentrionalis]
MKHSTVKPSQSIEDVAASSFGARENNNVPNKPKVDYSCIRGKMVLVSPTEEQYEVLRKKLEERIADSRGETVYEIGVGEDGSENGLQLDEYAASVATLQSLAAILNAECVELRSRKAAKGITGQYLVRIKVDDNDFTEIRVAVVGNVDAGKSTLLGVLTHGELDNGRGFARQRLFRHKHEIESGRTSSVGNDILGFDSVGNVVNKPDHGTLDWVKICEKSAKVITFIDLAGHERYLKTTVFGMTGHAPDFGMLMIGANSGIIGMTKEHLGLALALSVPVFVVITKIDMCPPNVLQENLKLLYKILKSQGCRKVPVMVKTTDDVVLSATNFVSERLCPIFQVSNVTGENLELLKMFLNLLTVRSSGNDNFPTEFQIDDTYAVPGVGTVVSGITLQGVVHLNDVLLLGPNPLGDFQPITVKSIHRKRMVVREVRSGQTASFALKKIKRSQIRKGMVLVSPDLNPQACWEFDCEILVLHHPTTISSKYGRWSAMVHCGSIRQTAQILQMSKECLRTGDKAVVRFRFIKNPEYMKPGQRMVFREGRTKAVGNVIAPLYTPGSVQQRTKPNKMQVRGGNAAQHLNNQKPLSKSANEAITDTHSPSATNIVVLDIGTDKRNSRPSNTHKKHRAGPSNSTAATVGSELSKESSMVPSPQNAQVNN